MKRFDYADARAPILHLGGGTELPNFFAMARRSASHGARSVANEGGQLAVEAVCFVVEVSVSRLRVERDLRFPVQRLYARGYGGLEEQVLRAIRDEHRF